MSFVLMFIGSLLFVIFFYHRSIIIITAYYYNENSSLDCCYHLFITFWNVQIFFSCCWMCPLLTCPQINSSPPPRPELAMCSTLHTSPWACFSRHCCSCFLAIGATIFLWSIRHLAQPGWWNRKSKKSVAAEDDNLNESDDVKKSIQS